MRSMTGYGAASGHVGQCRLTVEVRSVNQRFLDLKINAPREYGAHEAEWRRAISGAIERGRVEVYIGRVAPPRSAGVALQREVAAGYVKAWKQLKREFGLSGELDLSLFASRSEIFASIESNADVAGEVAEIQRLLEKALAAHAREREREGAFLKKDLQARLKHLRAIARSLKTAAAAVAPRLQARLQKRLGDLLAGTAIEPSRFVQETAILADRSDVTEELVRLESHLGALEGLLRSTDPLAKRVDFVLQEVNRELNTIGSKASDLDVTNLVVDGKAELEKLREQIQNVE